jgi:hypothetical protein
MDLITFYLAMLISSKLSWGIELWKQVQNIMFFGEGIAAALAYIGSLIQSIIHAY